MSPLRQLAPRHISLPPRVLSLSGFPSSGSVSSPHTPLPYGGLSPDFEERVQDAITLGESSTGKRSREEPVELEWSEEELEAVSSTLRHPFRPLSSAFPPGELPPPNILDELTSQLLAYGLKGSPGNQGDGWQHSWDATRKKVYSVALESSRSAHGMDQEKVPRAERVGRPGLRRMDSMDFLDQAEESAGTAIRLSTSLQNSAKGPSPPKTSHQSDSDGASETSSSSSSSVPTVTVSASSPRKRGPVRSTLNRPTRPTSLLQRGRSYTAVELQAEGSVSPQSTAQSGPTTPISPSPRKPARITRSQSSILPSYPQAHAGRDLFLQTKPKTPSLDVPVSLQVHTSSPSWSDSDDEDAKPKRTRSTVRRLPIRAHSDSSASLLSLQSPFDEKSSFL